MKKRLLALSFSLVVGLNSICQGGVSLHFFGQAPAKDRQPFMFAVSTTHQHPTRAIARTTPGERASQLHWEHFDAASWAPGQLNSMLGVGSGGRLGDFLAGLANLQDRPPRWQAGPPNPPSIPGGSDPPGGGSDDPGDDPGNDPGPSGGPSVVPEPTSGLLWCLAGVLLLAFTRRPRC